MTAFTSKAQKAALGIAAVAGATLVLRIILRLEISGGVIGSLSYLSQFFTILTNFLVFITMLLIGRGHRISPRIIRALTVAIACVGLVYHTVLAHLLDLSGLDLLADHGVHTIVPILTLLWWLFLAPKPKVSGMDPLLWTLWPLLYCGYILIRASGSGFYPYPFLNVTELGGSNVAFNVVILVGVFIVVGLALAFLERFLRTTPTPTDPA